MTLSFVLYEEEQSVAMELSEPNPTLPDVLWQFATLIRALPVEAREIWNRATKRVFNLGIQAGLEPFCIEWTLSADLMTVLSELGAELTLTVYGAKVVGPPSKVE